MRKHQWPTLLRGYGAQRGLRAMQLPASEPVFLFLDAQHYTRTS